MNDKVLLIGASGFVGTRLIETAISEFNIKNLDKQQSHFYSEITDIGDIRNQEFLNTALVNYHTVVLLAAEHRDDVSPISLYYDVNVQGTRNVLAAMEKNNVKNIIFTSSVAVYGLNKANPDENHSHDPFNHYGKSKWQAEEVLREWYNKAPNEHSLTIIRPTVIFGERNRGNVYNLLKQIASGKFAMIGSGKNYKSMAYVGNIVEFIKYKLTNVKQGYEVYNYVDKPDLNMNQLVHEVEKSLKKKIPSVHLPYPVGMLGGYCFDILSKLTDKKYAISSVRVKKFCATTQFDAAKVHNSGFVAPYTLSQGLDRTLQYEFVHNKKDNITFFSE
ncbi:NAD-dependent epimerase/dehydratase family protein [Xenorhabdus szentirmaii]|uniref:NAD-dependent epimerase/dehydratase family protein n=1 Tax=Xenorhabdus szentirmaii TaxID=290112 RepID=A0AAW3YVL8_9GAMM|nr:MULTISPECIES: NAD-dependent epimerase/dehydratase family protein [Xenorhabdus]MBD2781294.1 NAD-dependent epimerase/dehydratase family protein [Xenorhabdus sp. 38]MBD2800388.1 NAD-dependent epimerase/dehydratase family protein [Xenorhabdus sp. M]PHM43069.1 NAD-dependent epimerase/dehydratase [Xenorhabdus szentirmaii]